METIGKEEPEGVLHFSFEDPLDDNVLTEIGRVTVNFSRLEWELVRQCGRLVNEADAEVGSFVALPLSFSRRTELFATLLRRRASDPNETAEFENILEALREHGEDRNLLVHATWGREVGAELHSNFRRYVVVARQRKSKKGDRIVEMSGRLEPSQLRTLADEIATTTRRIRDRLA